MTTEHIKNRFSRISLAEAWVLTLFLALTAANAGESRLKLWYSQPAADCENEALFK